MISYSLAAKNTVLQIYATKQENCDTAMLCLHGGPGSGAVALYELPAFTEIGRHITCIYFDQRGCGQSTYDISQGLSIEDIVQDVVLVASDTRKRYAVKRLILWGGSFGGCLAALVMEKHQKLFDACILSSPAITFQREEAILMNERMRENYLERFAVPLQEKIRKYMATVSSPESFFTQPDIHKLIFSSDNPSHSLRHIAAMSNWYFSHSFETCLQRIIIPVLILQGRQDPICNYQNIEQALSRIRSKYITYIAYDDCGHAVFEDKQQEFIKEVLSFIFHNKL